MSKSEAPAPPGMPTHGVKVIVRGLEGDAELREQELNKYRGRISHFLGKQQQFVRLGDLRQHAATADFGGATARFHHNNGMETVVLNITAERTGGEERTTTGGFWDVALVEFIMLMTGDGASGYGPLCDVLLGAILRTPLVPTIRDLTPDDDVQIAPIQGAALLNRADTGANDSGSNPILAFPPDDYFQPSVGDAVDADISDLTVEFRSSLRVDLRKFAGALVEIDIYGEATNRFAAELVSAEMTEIVGVCVKGGNPWTEWSRHLRLAVGVADYRLWETGSFPIRPKMGHVGGPLSVHVDDFATNNGQPYINFDLPYLGRLKISTTSGSISFKPA